MENTIRRFAGLFICVALLFTTTSFATSDEELTISDNMNATLNSIKTVIQSIASEKEYYGFKDVDLTSIWLGKEIPTYSAENGELVRIQDSSYYPILDADGNLISIADTTIDDGEIIAGISAEFVDTIWHYAAGHEVALLYDAVGVSLWDGNVIRLANAKEMIQDRDLIDDIAAEKFLEISTSDLSKSFSLNISCTIQPQGFEDSSIYLSAPVKRQDSDTLWCWAACMASMIQYETGENLTTNYVAGLYTNSATATAQMSEVKSRFKDFDLYYSSYGDGTNLVNVKIIWDSLYDDHPVWGGFTGAIGGHAVVIRGLDLSAATFSVMDPAASGSNYRAGQMSNVSGNYATLVLKDFSTNKSYSLVEYLYM